MIICIFLPSIFNKILGATFIFNISLGDSSFLDVCHEFLVHPARRGSLKTRRRPRRLYLLEWKTGMRCGIHTSTL